jgi:copper transport protein
MTNQPSVVRTRLAFVGVCLAVLATVGWPASVSAHTDFKASDPANGAVVAGPLSSVTVEFTNPAVESGDGFELLEPDGTVRVPDSVDPTDGTSFVATFDPPLETGAYGFRWDVQAGDAHPIQGSFQFTVTGATSTTPPSEISTPAAVTPESSSTTTPVDHSTMSMDEFMADSDAPSPFTGRAARTMAMTSTVFAAGVIAALVWTVRGRRDEIDRLLVWVRLAGLGLVTGGLTALAALDETQSAALSDVATTKPGVAALMTMAGGVLVFAGFGSAASKVVGPPRSLSAAVAIDTVSDHRTERSAAPDPVAPSDQFRWVPDATAAAGLAGIVLALGAYWFDGHTVSRGPWIVHASVNLVHVTAASVWVGGVFAMTLLAWMRWRRRTDIGLTEMVVRFSTIAAVSLAALSVAGLVMAWLVLDSPGDLFSTSWGQMLLVKVGAVAIAASLGGYNHFVLRPALEAGPDDPEVAAHLRASLLIESVVMVAVVVITAVLVASST